MLVPVGREIDAMRFTCPFRIKILRGIGFHVETPFISSSLEEELSTSGFSDVP